VNSRDAQCDELCSAIQVRLDRFAKTISEGNTTDPDGIVTVGRFRRTLAWFIYRKPGGRVALGVQYGHLRSHTTDGYGSRVASGLRDVFPMEEVLARVDFLEEAYARLHDGERVTGPASRRYTEALQLFDR
jgi:hypothetical protein